MHKKTYNDSEAFWSYLYVWFGFLCAQVSSRNARQWSRRKLPILSVKPLFAAQTTPFIFRFCFATGSPISSFTCIQSTVELSSLGNQVCEWTGCEQPDEILHQLQIFLQYRSHLGVQVLLFDQGNPDHQVSLGFPHRPFLPSYQRVIPVTQLLL